MEAGLRGNFTVLATAAALAVVSCAPAEEDAPADSGEVVATPSETPSGKPAPDTFAGTAWRITAEDGARYTTLLDEDGTYRDLRNGDPWQEGDWTYADGPGGKQLCLKPDHEDGRERCWQPGRMKDDAMIATGPGDRRIELLKVAYTAPETGDAEGEAEE
ncbi:hypothetical protein [Qipengyuania sphaerica]|uniref:hypothetical protein n=1 Tax=Qipengyuania sphaerica TaxID=2867243 RepID=UPI001C87ED98|nr:hypothetical protein [Qipengyuania sphaerica]MBX7539475.1 hypothetical protein [Qipengyuania sphaerica]